MFEKVKNLFKVKKARRGLTSLIVDAGVVGLVIAIILMILGAVKGSINDTTAAGAVNSVMSYFGSFGPIVVLVMLAAGVLFVLIRAFKPAQEEAYGR